MADKSGNVTLDNGTITYSSDVIATIAGLAAVEIEGISGMSGNLVSGITEFLGKKDFTKGIKVDIIESDVTVDIYLVVKYGIEIHKAAAKVQENVHKAIESMTSLHPVATNIHVQGIDLGANDEQ